MMASWGNEGLEIGYILSNGEMSPAENSGLSDRHIMGVAYNLVYYAFRIFGLNDMERSTIYADAERFKAGLWQACTDGYTQYPSPDQPTGMAIESRFHGYPAYFTPEVEELDIINDPCCDEEGSDSKNKDYGLVTEQVTETIDNGSV